MAQSPSNTLLNATTHWIPRNAVKARKRQWLELNSCLMPASKRRHNDLNGKAFLHAKDSLSRGWILLISYAQFQDLLQHGLPVLLQDLPQAPAP